MGRIFSGGGTTNAIIGGLGATDNRALRSDGTGGQTAQGSSVVIDDSGHIGTDAATPTHSLTIPSTGTWLGVHNQVDQITNTEVGELGWSSNVFRLRTTATGTGTVRSLQLACGTLSAVTLSGVLAGSFAGGTNANMVSLTAATSWTSTSVVQKGLTVVGTVNQTSGTGGLSAIHCNITNTAVGSAGLKLAHLQVGSADKFLVAANGQTTICADTATPAGGSTTAVLLFGTTTGFGVYYGSGVPSVTAGQGSWYMRSDGSSGITRAYVNTDGGTTWTPFTTVA